MKKLLQTHLVPVSRSIKLRIWHLCGCAYVSAGQLSQLKLGQKMKVLTDDGRSKYKEHEGTLTWISSKAEFTPKSIQTKEERASTVYAVKVKVINGGAQKIGMYAEVKF